jgi:golgin subfamily A protein 1
LKVQLSEYKSIVIEKDDLLVLNAQLSNQLEQLKQQLEAQHRDKSELIANINTLKESSNYSTNEKTVSVSHLNETIDRLEKSLTDKNKTIKLQQQRLNDIKKTFLQNQSNREENVMEESPKHGIIESNSGMNDGLNEINMTYLRNVIFKYMISSEYEAIHLVKAISVLLNFSKDEEKLIKETIQWKMSWFAPLVAHKPSLLNRK